MTTPAPAAAGPDRSFVVQLEAFSGPLDLLLHLIREQEIDIADIPIARIADQFLGAIDTLGLNEAADYLEMAAYLLRIKVQMLLPRPLDDEEWEDPRAELVRRLLEYEQIREVADWLIEQASARSDRFARGLIPEPVETPPAPVVLNLEELVIAAQRLVEALPQRIMHRVVPRPLDVEGATRRIQDMLAEQSELDFLVLLGPEPTVTDIISYLIALLELARLGALQVAQPRPFGPVLIRRAIADQAA